MIQVIFILTSTPDRVVRAVQQRPTLRPAMARILVVDDEIVFADLIALLLRRESHSVSMTHDPQTALQMIQESQFDLLIAEAHLPPVNGLDFPASVYALQPSLQIVLLSGEFHSQSAPGPHLLSVGVRMLLPKPFLVAEFTQKIHARLTDKTATF
jgi:two-component system, response regulator FlrC